MKNLVILFLFLTQPVFAQQFDGFALLNSGPSMPVVRTQYKATVVPREEIRLHSKSLGFTQHDFGLNVPVSIQPEDEWLVGTSMRLQDYDTDALFPDSGKGFSEKLWDVSLTPTYRHRYADGRILGTSFTLGSASDAPFSGIRQTAVQFNAMYVVPKTEHSRLFLMLNYSNNRQFLNNIPLPGIGYGYDSPDGNLKLLAGLPFFMASYKFWNIFSVQSFYFVPNVTNLSLSARVFGPVQVYSGFSWTNQRYLLQNRATFGERLFYDEQRLYWGIRSPLSKVFFADLSAGYLLKKTYFTSERYFSNRKNQFDVEDGLVFSAQLSASF